MARPQPIIVPLARQVEGGGQTQAGQAIGQLLGQLLGRGIQQRGAATKEAQAQEAFRSAFPGLFPTEEVTAAGPQLPATGLPIEGAPEGAPLAPRPTAQGVPEDVRALTQLLSQTPQGRQFGQQFATQQAAQRLKPVTPVAPAKPAEPFISPELVEVLGLPTGTQLTTKQFKDIQSGLPKSKDIDTKVRQVQSSKILAGGLTQLVFKDGTIEIVESSEADSVLVKLAEERKALLSGLGSAERAAGAAAIRASSKANETIPKVKKNIVNLEEGIRLIDEGAETGVIAKRFPSIRAASLKLDQLQGELGLDVVGMTTFGALSKGELDLAKNVALPTGLEGPALKDWLIRKRNAQIKVLNNLTETAIFLGIPGNTISGFLSQKRAQQQAQPTGQIEFLGFE